MIGTSFFDEMPEGKVSEGRRKSSQGEKLRTVAVLAFATFLKEGRIPTRKECAEEVGDDTTNSISTMLGRGMNARGGAQTHRDAHGEMLLVYDNLRRLGDYLADGDLEKVLDETGTTEDELRQKLLGLPQA